MSVAGQTLTQTDLRTYAFTRDHVFSETQDHVFSHDPLTAIFLDKTLGNFGGVRMRGIGNTNQDGGASAQVRVRLGKHAGSKFLAGGWDSHPVNPDDNARLSTANWTHAAGVLAISDTDKDVHRGVENMASFVADQTESVMLSLVDTIADELQTTSSSVNAPTSLDSLISANDTAQGLGGDTYTQWNSRGVSARGTAAASVLFASGSFAAQGIADMRTAFNNASEGSIRPNVLATTYTVHEFYEGALQPQERFAGAVSVADGSFEALAFRKVPLLASPKTPSGYMWFLNAGSRGIQIITLSGKSFRFMPFKMSSTQEVALSELQWKGQLCIKNRLYGNNKLTTISA